MAESKIFEEARERFRKLEAARCAEEAVASPLPATLFVLEAQVETLQQMVNQLQAAFGPGCQERKTPSHQCQRWFSGLGVLRGNLLKRVHAPVTSGPVHTSRQRL